MEYIWAPWRMEFIQNADNKSTSCFLCQKPEEHNDKSNYILFRGVDNYVLLNAYPYNPGHLLVAPYRHVGMLENLSDAEASEHFDLVRKSVVLLKQTVKCAGFNIGMNLGKIAGAGVDDHIHTHIVPRWQGDTNFMPAVGNTKVLPQALSETYEKLVKDIAAIFC
jgi:ATP adenylyltransferase